MNWIKAADQKPEDDQTVFVINTKVGMLPAKAFYMADIDEYISVETLGASPLSITHWMPLPKKPEN